MLINYLLGRMHITATCAMIETLTIKALNVRRKQKGKINNYWNKQSHLCPKFQEEEARYLYDQIIQGLIEKAAT